MKKALITGGSGFIGVYLAQELMAHGYQVTVFDLHPPKLPGMEYIASDVSNFQLIQESISDVEVVFHLAGVLGTDFLCDRVQEAIDINIKGSVNVFEAAKESKVRVINTGLLQEWDNPYMISKKTAMRFGRMYHAVFGVDVTTVELSHVYGPGQRIMPYRKAIPNFIFQALRNEPLLIYGSGQRQMDCIYVTDVARILRLIVESRQAGGRVIPIVSGQSIRVVELAKKIISMTGSKSTLSFRSMRRGEPDVDEPNSEFVLKTDSLGIAWKPKIELDEGLMATIESFKAQTMF